MLDGVPVGDLTAPGLLLLGIALVFFGWLVPKRTLDRADRETSYWREAHATSEKARAEQAAQLTQLIEYARTANAVLASLQARTLSEREPT